MSQALEIINHALLDPHRPCQTRLEGVCVGYCNRYSPRKITRCPACKAELERQERIEYNRKARRGLIVQQPYRKTLARIAELPNVKIIPLAHGESYGYQYCELPPNFQQIPKHAFEPYTGVSWNQKTAKLVRVRFKAVDWQED